MLLCLAHGGERLQPLSRPAMLAARVDGAVIIIGQTFPAEGLGLSAVAVRT
jgi:hypothetical protein